MPLLRPWVRRWLGPEPGINDFTSYSLSAYGVFYGLVLGLIAVAAYQNFSTVETTVSKEATSIATLYRDMSAYPNPVRGQLQKHMQDYVHFLIDEAWPAQQQGQIHPGGASRITALHQTLLAFEPTSRRDEIVHAETLRQFNVFLEARYQRLQSATTALSGVLWWVVCIGAALNFLLVEDDLSLVDALSRMLTGLPWLGETSVGEFILSGREQQDLS